jgi:glycosyltransferase involved in cell wall biosynthesis
MHQKKKICRLNNVIFYDATLKLSPSKNNAQLPLVTFSIPVLNGGKTLKKCLKSIREQTYPYVEIVVVDNGSSDDSISIAKQFNAKIYSCSGPFGAVRQYGIDLSSGDLIAMWEADLYIPRKDWLERAVTVFMSYPNASTLWGLARISPPDGPALSAAYNWYSWSVIMNLLKIQVGYWGGGGSIFKRDAICTVGGIDRDVDTYEDFNLANKLTNKGYEVIFYDDPVYHDSHNTLSEFYSKEIRRSKNFKKAGISKVTGVRFDKLILSHIKSGFLDAPIHMFREKKPYLVIVPFLVSFRLMLYSIMFTLTKHSR